MKKRKNHGYQMDAFQKIRVAKNKPCPVCGIEHDEIDDGICLGNLRCGHRMIKTENNEWFFCPVVGCRDYNVLFQLKNKKWPDGFMIIGRVDTFTREEKLKRIVKGLNKVESKLSDSYDFYLGVIDGTPQEYNDALTEVASVILDELESKEVGDDCEAGRAEIDTNRESRPQRQGE